jgi:cytoskeletal protein CcmA (bactofilin family)
MVRVKAGSLQLVTFVVVVIALLLASFILLMHIHKQLRIKTNHTIEAVELVNHGIETLLSQSNGIKGDTIEVNLYDKDYKSLKLYSEFWGSFEKSYAIAKIKNKTLSKLALVGAKTDKSSPSLYLKENNKPLVLVGQTTIKGNAFLPKRGFKSGNISGQSYYGEQYIYGNTLPSKDLPKLNKHLLNYLNKLKLGNIDHENINYININGSKIHKNSFKNRIQLAFSSSDIFLTDVTITGQIIIQSQTKITVDNSAKLQDVILIAPTIHIQQNVIGSFQAIATKRLNIGKNVNLQYPSALVLLQSYKKNEQYEPNMITVNDDSKISGQILVLGKTQPNNYDAQIKINPNAIVEGTIYCQQNLELRGSVYGSVYTDNFIIKEGGSVYQNHLYNAIIDNTDLTSEFVGLYLERNKKGVAKWLY